ncbi:methyltransferase [Dongia sp.]|uniref:methyltransferase n=1 Tax=Dongia sp. TaxID=1977262 RepID=UPI00375351CF
MTDATIRPDTIDRLEGAVPAALAMMAGLQLGVFTRLGDGPLDTAALAARIGCGEERLQRLLHALVVAGLLEKRTDDAFANTPEADTFLVEGRPRYRGSMHALTAHLWETDLKTAQSIHAGAPAAAHDFSKAPDEALLKLFTELHPGTISTAKDLLQVFDFSAARAVIDIGGGSGGLVATLCAAFPALQGTLLELPRCAGLIEPLLRATPGGERVTIEAGDIVATPLAPERYDAAILRALVQVLGPDEAARAIRHAAAGLRPGGALYIIGGGILDDNRLGPEEAVYLNLTFLNFYTEGRAHTESAHRTWLAEAGCGAVRRLRLPSGRGAIVATRL